MHVPEKCNYSSFRVRKLRNDETIESFDCGNNDLNDFIVSRAQSYHKLLIAVTYICEDVDSGAILGYFSLAYDKISIDDFDSNTDFNRFRRRRFINEKRIRSYPAVKICRLGVHNKCKGTGIGTILIDFIKSYFLVNNKAGCRFITVDAYNNAVLFYERNDFKLLRVGSNDSDITKLLYYDLNDMIA